MRKLWNKQYLRPTSSAFIRSLPRVCLQFHNVGYSVPPGTSRCLHKYDFTRSYHSHPSAQSQLGTCVSEDHNGIIEENGDVEAPILEQAEVSGISARLKGSPNLFFSRHGVKNKLKNNIEWQYPVIKTWLDQPVDLVHRIRDCGLLSLERHIMHLGTQKFRVKVECKLLDTGDTLWVEVDASRKFLATRNAYWLLLNELHDRGVLFNLAWNRNGWPLIHPSLIQPEMDGLIDVYNYAARYRCVPEIDVHAVPKKCWDQTKAGVEVTIKLPQKHIRAAATSRTFEISQAAAVFQFKQQAERAERAERRHANNEATMDRSGALNTKNIHEFLKFYNLYQKTTTFSLVMKGINDFGRKPYFQASVLVNGEIVAKPVVHLSKKGAASLAYLTTGLTILAGDTSLEDQFLTALRKGNGRVLATVQPSTVTVAEDCLFTMEDSLNDLRESGLPDDTELHQPDIQLLEDRRSRIQRFQMTDTRAGIKSLSLRAMLRRFQHDPRLADLRYKLDTLPINSYRIEVSRIVNRNTFSIIVGATGSGKTTQVPQILLDQAIQSGNGAYCNIICTQPRRIAASSVARRVAQERDQELRETVGYHVRYDPQLPRFGGSITYCTTGILLVQLQLAPDEIFDSVSHLVIDEVHERDIELDFLLILLKNTVMRRRQERKSVPKIILMSATVDAEVFANYFEIKSLDGIRSPCPTLQIPGRTFPVKEFYLEDLVQQFSEAYKPEEMKPFLDERTTASYLDKLEENYRPGTEDDGKGDKSLIDWDNLDNLDLMGEKSPISTQHEDPVVPIGLICATVAHIVRTSEAGAILVFLPGLGEIDAVHDILMQDAPLDVNFSNSDDYRIFKLHSLIPANQTDVFEPLPGGCRKIVLSTNIAETSVTIPDVQYVVDTGKVREKIYDQPRRISKLACCWISKSNAKQRAGRAGRVQNGNYYALYTREQYSSLRAIGVPELLRMDLQEVCLSVRSQKFQEPVQDFLAQAMEAPSPTQVDVAVANLRALGALDQQEDITALGRLLAQLPVHPALGKMIVLGIIFRCLDPMLLIGAAEGERSLWRLTSDTERSTQTNIRRDYVGETKSEHVGFLNAFRDVRKVLYDNGEKAAYEHCQSKLISFGSFRNTLRSAQHILGVLKEANLIPPVKRLGYELGGQELNMNSSCVPLVKALLTSGLFPNMAVSTTRRKAWRTENEATVRLHPRSIHNTKSVAKEKPRPGNLMVYSSMQKASIGEQLFLRDAGEITPLVAMLFGGRLTGTGHIVTMDSWLPFLILPPVESVGVPYKPAKMIIEFRKALDRVLSVAFRDLTKFANGQSPRSRIGDSPYLADDPIRDMFAERCVEVLRLDVKPK